MGLRYERLRREPHEECRAAFLNSVMRTPYDSPEELDPSAILFAVDVGRDGTVHAASVEALLLAELDAWQWLGLRLGYFEGEPAFSEAVRGSDALKVYFELTSRAGPVDNEPPEGESFQSALVQALEDLRPERIELIRMLTLASDKEFHSRIRQLVSAPSADRRSIDLGQLGTSVDWALSGRESTIESRPGPAAWRSNRALEESPRWAAMNRAGARVATQVLLDVLGEASYDDIVQAVFRETGEGGVAYA